MQRDHQDYSPARQRSASENNMRKRTEKQERRYELRREYDLSKLKGGVRGKYLARFRAGTNFVLLSPDVAEYFPDEQSPAEVDDSRRAGTGAPSVFSFGRARGRTGPASSARNPPRCPAPPTTSTTSQR